MATGFNVNSNISSMKTYRAFAHSQTKLEESIERLSTGLRINKASDDTEGAAIATRLSNRVRSLQKAQTNSKRTIDMLQTLEIANNDNYYEKNKILGKHPSEAQVITYFIVRGFAHYEATKMIPVKYRSLWHTYNVVYNYDVIRDNHNIGIRIDF